VDMPSPISCGWRAPAVHTAPWVPSCCAPPHVLGVACGVAGWLGRPGKGPMGPRGLGRGGARRGAPRGASSAPLQLEGCGLRLARALLTAQCLLSNISVSAELCRVAAPLPRGESGESTPHSQSL